MKTTLLFLMILSLFTACETGTKYEKNTTTHKRVVLTDRSGGAYQDIDALVSDDEELEDDDSLIQERIPDKAYVDIDDEGYVDDKKYVEDTTPKSDTFERQEVSSYSSGLDIHSIRVGKHDDYIRMVMDVYKGSKKAPTVGSYSAKYYADKDEIVVTLNGYNKFSASLPSFPANSVVKQIVFGNHKKNEDSYKFSIKLRQEAKVRIFDLKNPARLVFDIKPI